MLVLSSLGAIPKTDKRPRQRTERSLQYDDRANALKIPLGSFSFRCGSLRSDVNGTFKIVKCLSAKKRQEWVTLLQGHVARGHRSNVRRSHKRTPIITRFVASMKIPTRN